MPDVVIEKGITLDLLDSIAPATSTTTDMPVVETKPDASPAKSEEPAAPVEGKTAEEPATPETPEDSAASDKPKPAKGVQKRIDELTKQREDEKRRAEAAEARLDRALTALERGVAPKPQDAQPADAEDVEPEKPVKFSFSDPEAYDQALADYAEAKAGWIARKEVRASIAAERQRQQDAYIANEQTRAREAYAARMAKAREKYADYETVAQSPDITVSIPMAHAIVQSEHGPDIQYFLGQNPLEAKRISSLNPALQLMELGLIAAKLAAPAAAVAAKPAVSAAPKPVKPLNAGSDAQVAKSPEEESMEEYAARRKTELAAQHRPGVRH